MLIVSSLLEVDGKTAIMNCITIVYPDVAFDCVTSVVVEYVLVIELEKQRSWHKLCTELKTGP